MVPDWGEGRRMTAIGYVLAFTNGPIGKVRIDGATVREALSTPTSAQVRIAADHALDVEAPLGTAATLEVKRDGATERTWHLKVVEVRFERMAIDEYEYTVLLAHPLAFTSYRADVRMFQKTSVDKVVEDVLQRASTGLTPKWHLKRTLPTREYCVQYRETDFDFVSRLLEHEGIFYECDAGDGTGFSLSDNKDAFKPIDGDEHVAYVAQTEADGVCDFVVEYGWTTDKVTVKDWNFDLPKVTLEASEDVGSTFMGEVYEFPGGFSDTSQASDIALVRAEEVASRQVVGWGRSNDPRFRPARKFKLTSTSRDSLNDEWSLRAVTHTFTVRIEGVGDYVNSFTCSPASQPYRPQRVTKPPVAAGSDCVVVTGPSGEEIHTDKYGRMTGKFYWDRDGKDDETSSRWIRVVQLAIGGSMALARTKWEMVCRYLYGDPDRPIAIARVDNGVHTSPYAYPKAASAMALKTLTSPGGGKHNEYSMEDGGGGMKVGVTASKDYTENTNLHKTQKIGNNEKLDVGVDAKTTVDGSQKISIGAMLSRTVSSDAGVEITGDRTKTVGAAEMVTITGTSSEQVHGSDTESVGACRISAATMGVSRTTKGSTSLTVGGAMIEASGMGCSVATLGARSETVGAAKLVLSGGACEETVIGAMAQTIGGVLMNNAAGKSKAATKGAATLEVGGVAMYNAADQLQIRADTIKITVGGVVNLLGGGGVLNMTPGSASFVGLVTLKGSNGVTMSGAPNLVG
jgi:type VI secretion system secreted protein VgrG